jgi:hypothetical protein
MPLVLEKRDLPAGIAASRFRRELPTPLTRRQWVGWWRRPAQTKVEIKRQFRNQRASAALRSGRLVKAG